MKKVFILEIDEMRELENHLREINHSLSVISQNKNNEECINENLSLIQICTNKALGLIK